MQNNARVAAVTGASSGIGLATAKLFADRGYIVYCLSRSAPPDPRLIHIKTDVTIEAEVEAAFRRIEAERSRLDVLVSNAGMGISGPVESTSLADAKYQFDVNFFGLHLCAKYAAPLMRKTGGGRIIAVSSVAAVFGLPYQGFYSATKTALNVLAQSLGIELARFNIRVVTFMCGDTKTGFTDVRVKCGGDELYGKTVEASLALMEKDEREGMPPEAPAKKIVALAEAKNPKPLSSIGFKYKLFCFLSKALPIRVLFWMVKKIYTKEAE
ncbi:MAG TPA: SDR family NAD(P)-dependent oxidoreductase [Clostridia bacterium]|nr:SDR family NAD(P)-dependent oxidoreductase [Clostridia bacterium]